MKIKAKNEDCYLTVTIKCGIREQIEIDMLERFSQKGLPFFLKVCNCKKKKVVYSGIRAISLKEYLMQPISKFDLFFVLAQFVRLVKSIEDNNLPLSYISYDLNNCYLTDTTNELQLMFLPIKSKKIRQLPSDFVEALMYSSTSIDNGKYIANFAYFYRNQSGFNAKSIEHYIQKEEPTVYQLLDGKNANAKDKEWIVREKSNKGNSSENENQDDDLTLLGEDNTLLGDDDNTLLGEESTLLGDADETELGKQFDDEETEYLSCGRDSRTPYLKRVSTDEIIKLTKACFRIGVKEIEVDYVIRNNTTISRSHADFIIDAGEFYVCDLSSKNKTFVNNRVIPPQTRVQIYPNDIIRLSDEDFIFCV